MPDVETPRLNIGRSFDADLCEGNIRLLDAHIQWMEENFDGPHDYPLWVYLYGEGATLDMCPVAMLGVVAGCWKDPVAHTTWDLSSHELTHAYMSEINTTALPYLREGLAEAVSGAVQGGSDQTADVLAEHILEPDVGFGLYQEAGHFMRWLLEVYGSEAVIELYSRADLGISAHELSLAMEASLGVNMDSLLQDYSANALNYYPGLGPYACGEGEPLAWDKGVVWSGEFSCSDETVIGRYYDEDDEDAEDWRRWRLDVPESGVYEISISGGGGSISRCLSEALDESSLPLLDEQVQPDWYAKRPLYRPYGTGEGIFDSRPVQLDAGTYDLWVVQDRSDTNRLMNVSITP
ncbi:MAG: hypothetical protein H6711_04270 [Myxococcales bacterium]|nr:hypothetical protein [Myxococcales bacterium]